MKEIGRTTSSPDAITYSTIMSILWHNKNRNSAISQIWNLYLETLNHLHDEHFQLDILLFERLLDILSQFGDGSKAERVLNQILSLENENDINVKMTTKCCNLVLKGECLYESSFFDNKISLIVQITVTSFTFVIDTAYANRKNGNKTPVKAQEALVRMIERYKLGEQTVIPDIVGFNTV